MKQTFDNETIVVNYLKNKSVKSFHVKGIWWKQSQKNRPPLLIKEIKNLEGI
jgi:hypothetical protein